MTSRSTTSASRRSKQLSNELAPPLEFKKVPIPYKPHAYNRKAIKFLIENAAAALFQDPGMGKTAETLAAISVLIKKGLVTKVLLIAPLRVCHLVWPKEVKKWKDFNHLRVVVLHGPKKDQLLKEDADIYVINPEGLDWLLKAEKFKNGNRTRVTVDVRKFKLLGFDTLVIDELSKFKHTSTNRFKALKHVLGTFGRRWGLTGSPAANGLLDLFGQCYVLDLGRTFGPYITHYRTKYFHTTDRDGFNWVPNAGAEGEIYRRVAPLALRMSAADYLELPELVPNKIILELPPDVRKLYDQLSEELITQVDDHTIVAKNAAAASVKCRQVANGGLYLADARTVTGFKLEKVKREWVNLHTVKVDALADLIDELQGSPLLVAYDFEHDLDRLRAKLGQDVPYLGSGVSTKRSQQIERDWNDGKLPVLLGHPVSIAHGLNLQEMGNHVCWHSMTYDYELYDQFIRRVLRQGNAAKRVFVHHLMMKDTVDMVMWYSLHRKANGQNAFFDALKLLAKVRSYAPLYDEE